MKLYFEYIAYVLTRNILKLFSFNAASSIGGFLLKNLGTGILSFMKIQSIYTNYRVYSILMSPVTKTGFYDSI